MKSVCKLHMKQQWIISHLCNALEKFPGFMVGPLGQQNLGMTHKFCISQVGMDNLTTGKVFPLPAFLPGTKLPGTVSTSPFTIHSQWFSQQQ